MDDVDLSYNFKDGWIALEIAKRRRDSNDEWSRDVLQPPDMDPRAWFSTFMVLWADIKDKQKQISNGISKLSLSTGVRMTNEEVFEGDSLDEDQDTELCEDAPESPRSVPDLLRLGKSLLERCRPGQRPTRDITKGLNQLQRPGVCQIPALTRRTQASLTPNRCSRP